MKLLVTILSSALCCNTMAAHMVDMYGDESAKGKQVLKKYRSAIKAIAKSSTFEIKHPSKDNESKLALIKSQKDKLVERIKNENQYLYANLEILSYPSDKNTYTTLEVIDKNHPERLNFVKPTSNIQYTHNYNDVIADMIHYKEIGSKLNLTKDFNSENINCAAYFCLWGFNEAQLKPYLQKFQTADSKDKQLILQTLNQDKNAERRAAAALLIGHWQNPQEIITTLAPHVLDNDSNVRSNVMLVLAATMDKAKIIPSDIRPFISALNSPLQQDRSIALMILSQAANKKENHHIIKQNGDKLIANLRLKDPANRDSAYLILKKISEKDFGVKNIRAWQKWIKTVQV